MSLSSQLKFKYFFMLLKFKNEIFSSKKKYIKIWFMAVLKEQLQKYYSQKKLKKFIQSKKSYEFSPMRAPRHFEIRKIRICDSHHENFYTEGLVLTGSTRKLKKIRKKNFFVPPDPKIFKFCRRVSLNQVYKIEGIRNFMNTIETFNLWYFSDINPAIKLPR